MYHMGMNDTSSRFNVDRAMYRDAFRMSITLVIILHIYNDTKRY